MSQIIGYSTEGSIISGTIRDHSPGEPERFSGFSLPRSAVSGAITEARLATALGITLSDPEPPTTEANDNAVTAAASLLPPGYFIAPPDPASVVTEAGAAALEQGLGLPTEQGTALVKQLYTMLANGEGVVKLS